jgi:hypothetical protein
MLLLKQSKISKKDGAISTINLIRNNRASLKGINLKHVITVIKQRAKTFILLTQEGKLIMHLVVGIRVRVALCALLAAGAQRHGAEAVSREAAQPTQVLGRLPALATIAFVFTAA